MHLVLYWKDRMVMLLVYWPPCWPVACLTKMFSSMVLEDPRTIDLSNFSTHMAVARGPAWDFMASMTTMEVS